MVSKKIKTDLNSLSLYVRDVVIHTTCGLSQSYLDPDYSFTYIFEGRGSFLLEGKKFTVTRGSMILLPPYMLHIIDAPPGVSIVQYIIKFDCCYIPERKGIINPIRGMTFKKFLRTARASDLQLAYLPPILTVPSGDQKTVEDLFLRLKHEFGCKSYASELMFKAIMFEVLLIYLHNAGGPAKAENVRLKSWRNLEKAIAFIQENMRHPLALEDVSRAAGLSQNYCCALFKNYTHVSIHRYLNIARIQKAKILIDKADMNFSEIADAVGFSSIHLFSRIFKKVEGMAPGHYAQFKMRAGNDALISRTGFPPRRRKIPD